MPLDLIIQLTLLGLFVGFAAGLLGVGGGGIMVPMLTSLFISAQIAPSHAVHLALGTSMASIITTSMSSTLSHLKHRNIDWFYVKALTPFIVIGAILVSFLIPLINTALLAVFFSLFMFFISVKMLINKAKLSASEHSTISPKIAGTGIGAISTIVAIGGAVITVPYLLSRGLDMRKAIGSSAAIGFAIAVSGTIGYAINGHIDDQVLLHNHTIIGFVHIPSVVIISVCGIFMAPLGVKLSTLLPVNILKKIFAILLVCLSIKMLLNVFA